MNDKQQILTALREDFSRWEELLAGLGEAQIGALHRTSDLSIKDGMAHLMAWQQISIARLEAARLNREPEFLNWPAGLDPESAADLDRINAWIYETNRDQVWSSVHRDWSAGFLRFLELAEAIPEMDLLDTGRYPWLEGYALSDVLAGSHEHHHEHLEQLLVLLAPNEGANAAS